MPLQSENSFLNFKIIVYLFLWIKIIIKNLIWNMLSLEHWTEKMNIS